MVLIDEYDKPILDVIDNKELAIKNRDILKSLYAVLKPLDQYLHLVFLTGVSKFSKVSIFSGLNQLRDITISKEFSDICGYTQKELTDVFKDRLEGLDLDKIREWYNGYSWCGDKVYNPFDILLYLSEKRFYPFWFETGTPTFLIKFLLNRYFDTTSMENVKASEDILSSFDVDNIEISAMLFQPGYLTIKDCEEALDGVIYTLTYPNKEVAVALNRSILAYITQNGSKIVSNSQRFQEILKTGDIESLEDIIVSLFESIPYDWYINNDWLIMKHFINP